MNIQLQDVSIIVNGTSRYNGNKYDTIRVETLLVTDEPIPKEVAWFVPSGTSIPAEVADFFDAAGLTASPIYAPNILKGTEDIREQAEGENLPEVMNDAARFLLRAVMKKVSMQPIVDASNTYVLSYEYKVYPVENNDYEVQITVPFDGLVVKNGGRVQLSVLTPIGAKIDPNLTKGIADDGNEITEHISELPNVNRQVCSFGWQRDPAFTIRYRY